ncbi:MAG: transglutaminase-like domain-containing protein [Gemmataceae bacterium]|nr:transglutaminase-like domain-containing protein [Gemmata sp.]MDW8196113.1 transglutaminase-like domain-containing protein [Gemmataceae bacterium]
MAPDIAQAVRRVTFALLAIAAVAVEIAAMDTRPVLHSVARAAVWIGIAAVMAGRMPIPAQPRQRPPGWVTLIVLALTLAPLAIEPLRRSYGSEGYPLELQMVMGLRNAGLAFAACSGWLLCLRLACVTSLFLMLFAAAMTNHPASFVLLGLYTAVGGVWLMLVYWSSLQRVFATPQYEVAIAVASDRLRLPSVSLIAILIVCASTVAVLALGPRHVGIWLGELLPTSGGTGEVDPWARYGVGDGPEEVAGDNAQAAGMVETDTMIEDNKNALIDAVSDMFGMPHKPPKHQEKMVAGGLTNVIQNHGELPENQRPSRDFDTSRQGRPPGRKPSSRLARGLFEVEGRTPLHIRQVVYTRYDANRQEWLEARKPTTSHLEAEDGDWMRLGHLREANWYAEDDRHRIKTAAMTTNLVPTPALLTRFRIKKVDRPQYYEWEYEGVVALAGRRKTPPGIVITTICRTLEPSRLAAEAFPSPGFNPHLEDVPPIIRNEIAPLAQLWAGDYPRGWPQIAAILHQLRTDYTLDPDIGTPADHPCPVLWFLMESRRGPDYLFASAATFLLRTLGYPTRLCLGYYVSPEAYDRETAHTPVRASDLHFWPEVQLRDGQWLVVEPTPGYETLAARQPLTERIVQFLRALAAWAYRNEVALTVVLGAICLTVLYRRQLWDRVLLWRWRLFPAASWQEQVRRAVRLLERRARWARRPRPVGLTVRAWLRHYSSVFEGCDRLARLVERASYAPRDVPPGVDSPQAVCAALLSCFTYNALRKFPPPPAPARAPQP